MSLFYRNQPPYVAIAAMLVAMGFWGSCPEVYAEEPDMQQGQPERFVQDRFAIGFFNDPPAGTDLEAGYQEIADAHFTVALVGSLEGDSAEVLHQKLALCRKHDIKPVVVQFGVEPRDLVKDDFAWGYGLADEPNVKDFPELAKFVEAVHKARPGKLAIINLFPSYASQAQLGAPTYEEHVAQYMDQVDVDVLCMDNYPHFRPGEPDGRDVYCADLAVMRRYSQQAGVPFWNFFNTMPYGNQTDPTEAQLRWQVFASLTYGARGVFYFCYWTPTRRGSEGVFEFPKGGAIITSDGRRTRHYEQAKRINERVKNLGPTLMKLTSTGVYRVGPEDEPASVLTGSPIADLKREDYDPAHDYLVGAFRHEDGRRAVMLFNYHFAYCMWPTVVFDAEPAQVFEVNQWTGQETRLRDDSPAINGFQVSLDAGEARLFLLP